MQIIFEFVLLPLTRSPICWIAYFVWLFYNWKVGGKFCIIFESSSSSSTILSIADSSKYLQVSTPMRLAREYTFENRSPRSFSDCGILFGMTIRYLQRHPETESVILQRSPFLHLKAQSSIGVFGVSESFPEKSICYCPFKPPLEYYLFLYLTHLPRAQIPFHAY